MTLRSIIANIVQQDDVNFFVTNRIPRQQATKLAGWFSKIENRLLCALSIRVWRLFTELDLSDATQSRFASLHACFTRTLKPGARPINGDPDIVVSPCDAIVGACGQVRDGQVLQVKGLPYEVEDLLGDAAHAERFRDGHYVTLRLTSAMYHRFHAPHDCRVTSVTHLFGDRWNVNPATLRRIKRLYCRNERAILTASLADGTPITLVPVAAILVAGIRMNFLDIALSKGETRRLFICDRDFHKGDELGWFEHGSTIILFVPTGFSLCADEGSIIKMGQGLLRKEAVLF